MDGWKIEVCEEWVLLTYADDIEVMGEIKDEVINPTFKLMKASKTINFWVNEEKRKYWMVARSPYIDHITIDDYNFIKV